MLRKLPILSLLGCNIFQAKFHGKKFFDIDFFRLKGYPIEKSEKLDKIIMPNCGYPNMPKWGGY